jgi:hypothetical protein
MRHPESGILLLQVEGIKNTKAKQTCSSKRLFLLKAICSLNELINQTAFYNQCK